MNSIPPKTPGELNLENQGFIQTSPGVFERPKPGQVVVQPGIVHKPVDRERDLHEEIIRWCDSQWPRVKFVHSRMDRPTGMESGIADFILFLPSGRTICVEAKAKGGKLSNEQMAWHKEMAMLGHHVLVVYSIEEFKILIQQPRGKK